VDILLASFETGGVFAIGVLGLVMSFRIVGFPDLTTEGSFTTGAAVSALLTAGGVSAALSLVAALGVGAVAGVMTATLNSKGGINRLLAGIITMTVLYTINLRIMGAPNISLLQADSLFARGTTRADRLAVIWLLVLAFTTMMLVLLKTEFGLFLRASGENSLLLKRAGLSVAAFTIFGLAIANAAISLSGALLAQLQGFADIGMGMGLIVVALASLLIGEAIVSPRNVLRLLLAAVIGALIYQLVLVVALRLGIDPRDLKLTTGILLAIAVVVRRRLVIRGQDESIGVTPL